MKRNWRLCILIIMALFLTGCYNYQATMIIAGDKSVDFTLNFAIDVKDLSNVLGKEQTTDDLNVSERIGYSNENIANLREKGYEVTENQDDYNYSISLHKKFPNIEDLVSEKKVDTVITNISNKDFKEVFFTKEKHIFNTTYVAHFIFDYSITDATPDISYYQENADDFFDLKFNVLLPSKAVNHNAKTATENDQNLEWKLNFGEANDVSFSFNYPTMLGKVIKIIAICLIIIMIVVGIIIYLKRRKKNNFGSNNSVIMEEDKSDKLESEALSLVSPVENNKPVENTTGSFASSNLAQEINNSNQNKSNNK